MSKYTGYGDHMSTTAPPVAPPKTGGRLLLWIGVLAAIAGVVVYQFQMNAGLLTTPWYAPALATLGTVLILVSLLRRFSAWRLAALLLIGALTAGEWWFLVSYSKVPDYSGPVEKGKPFPEFSAALADGTVFTQDSLKGDQDTIMVFFRGHW
jgi:hypothetical protein